MRLKHVCDLKRVIFQPGWASNAIEIPRCTLKSATLSAKIKCLPFTLSTQVGWRHPLSSTVAVRQTSGLIKKEAVLWKLSRDNGLPCVDEGFFTTSVMIFPSRTLRNQPHQDFFLFAITHWKYSTPWRPSTSYHSRYDSNLFQLLLHIQRSSERSARCPSPAERVPVRVAVRD